MNNYIHPTNSLLSGEVRARLGNVVNEMKIGLYPENGDIEDIGEDISHMCDYSDNEKILTVKPDQNWSFNMEFKNGGTIKVNGNNLASIEIEFPTRLERARDTYIPSELDGCYHTLQNLPKWMKEIIDGLNEDEPDITCAEQIVECNSKLEKLKMLAREYAELRIRSRNLSDQKFVKGNQERTEAHDRLVNILSEYVDAYISYARPLEEHEIREVMKSRKKVGDLACYFLFMEGVQA